ncbi:MAG: hypothetical protein ACTHU0_05075 [Kofleriaceae bacterium]
MTLLRMTSAGLISRRPFERYRAPVQTSPTDELLRIHFKEIREIKSVATLRRGTTRKTPCRRFRVPSPKSEEVIAAVVAHSDFANIVSLEIVDSYEVLGEGLIGALREGRLAHLRHLRLHGLANPKVLAAVFETPSALEVLELESVRVADAQLACFIRDNRLSSLSHLGLANVWRAGNETAAAIATGAFSSLAMLTMSWVSVGDAGLRALAEGPALGRLQALRYHGSCCGARDGLDVKLSVAAVPALNKIDELVGCVSFRLDLEEDPLEPATDVGAHMKPSLEAFRSIWLALEADPSGIETARSTLSAWPTDVCIPPPYAINHLVDGRASRALLRIARGLRIFDLVLDEATHKPLPREASDAQISKLVGWLGTLEDEAASIEVLDASAEAWVEKLAPTYGDLSAAFFRMTREAWSLLCAKLLGVRVLNLSQRIVDYDIDFLDDGRPRFEALGSFPYGMERELVIEELLAEAPLASGLKELYLHGYSDETPTVLDVHRFPALPSLEVLDFSGHWHRHKAKDLGPKLPSLQRLILGGDGLIRYALDKGSPELLGDFGIGTAVELEALLLGEPDVAAIRGAMPKLKELLLGGEVARKRVGKKHPKLVVRDAQGRADRRWLVW